MKENENLEKVHEIVLDLYGEFRKLCKKHSLKYVAISGTTIGAALWKGFIPWDDDMDIAMPAEDYLKFEEICKKELSDGVGFKTFLWFGGKLYDKNTTYTDIHYLPYPEKYTGIFIDVVPLIGLPDDGPEYDSFMDNFRNYMRASMLWDRYCVDSGYTEDNLEKWRNEILLRYDIWKAKRVMDFSDPRYILDSSGFRKPVLMKFENTKIPVSSNWENDLKIQYVNFQKYPPKDKRRSHLSEGIFSLERPCADLAGDYLGLSKYIREIIEKKTKIEAFYLDEMLRLKNENIILARKNAALDDYKSNIEKRKLVKVYRAIKKRVRR